MEILRSIEELRQFQSKSVSNPGFVPTMGALHKGHLSLINKSVKENENTIVSIFVNPKQFLPNEDLNNYPRNEKLDIELCKYANASAIFIPNYLELYGEDEVNLLAPQKLSSILEGKTRPGHFDGVLNVLIRFFNLINPSKAYFGKKDAQQLIIVSHMVRNLFLNIDIVPCDIIRNSGGLALSSRNSYLNDKELYDALKIKQSLDKALTLIKNKELDSQNIKDQMLEILSPLQVDYIEICDRKLNKIEKVKINDTIILVAAYVNKTRLLDNLWV